MDVEIAPYFIRSFPMYFLVFFKNNLFVCTHKYNFKSLLTRNCCAARQEKLVVILKANKMQAKSCFGAECLYLKNRYVEGKPTHQLVLLLVDPIFSYQLSLLIL